MQLLVLNQHLERVGMVTQFTSLRWRRKYVGAGEFELHAPIKYADLLAPTNILYRKDDLEAAHIVARQYAQDSSGIEEVVATGYMLKDYLSRRCFLAPVTLHGKPEDVIRSVVDMHAISARSDRIIPHLILEPHQGYIGTDIQYQAEMGAGVLVEIGALEMYSGLSGYIGLDPQCQTLIFRIRQGLRRTLDQDVNPRAILTLEGGMITEPIYTQTLSNYGSVAIVEGSDRVLEVEQAQGLDRYEVYCDATSLQKTYFDGDEQIVLTETEYVAALKQRGAEALAERRPVQTLDAKVVANDNLIYKSEYDLGDIVTIKLKRWNVQADVRIAEIEEIYEVGGPTIYLTVGDPAPTLYEKITTRR
ncbi:siphovirus ReqiPepy6 Gp37-like family protein [Gehongia tenuis]|uniref:Siphovirus ReqiPepy6 Gp37-like family protein n=1 Tax=Gehongia tenuis TaxID=2763655 RepID=A0A926D4V2_9FIRM|nr:siphovirus ReqiPepy6 Gp37-like family protein [Gehongia tenuis]MBC8531758.1 siphovirus ReqiPepy6 Gp37-like family protein [Gehongia tenuis]